MDTYPLINLMEFSAPCLVPLALEMFFFRRIAAIIVAIMNSGSIKACGSAFALT